MDMLLGINIINNIKLGFIINIYSNNSSNSNNNNNNSSSSSSSYYNTTTTAAAEVLQKRERLRCKFKFFNKKFIFISLKSESKC